MNIRLITKLSAMKKVLLLFIVLPFFLDSCIMDGWNSISGNGNVVEDTRDVEGFSGVHVSSGIDVLLSEGNRFEVVVEADENLQEYIETELRGTMLVVGTDNVNIRRARARRVHVTLPRLEELKISSAGDCQGQTPFSCDDLRISISSAGDLNLKVEADRIDLDISSSGDAKISGKASMLDASLSSAGDLDAWDLEAGVVNVKVSSAGDARVFATEEISMDASSAGNIYYRGDPKVTHSRSSSAGDIVKRD